MKQVAINHIHQANPASRKTVVGRVQTVAKGSVSANDSHAFLSKQRAKKLHHVDSLANHLIRWSKEHQMPVGQSVAALSHGALTKKTASSLNAIAAAFTPDILFAAANLLADFEFKHGSACDVLERAAVISTRNGFTLSPVYLHDSER